MAQRKFKYAFFSAVLYLVIFFLGSAAFIISMQETQYGIAGRALAQSAGHERLRLEAAVNGEIALVLKMADSPIVQRYFLNPDDSEIRDIAFAEFAGYRRIFMPKSIYWVNDIDRKLYLNDSYSYTVDPDDPADYWYVMTLNGKELFNFNINHNPYLNVTNFWINAPVYNNDGKPIGTLGTGVAVDAFIDTVFRNYSGSEPLYFFNKSGEITGAPDQNLVTRKVKLDAELGRTGNIILSRINELDSVHAQYFKVPGGIAALVSIPEFEWYVCLINSIGIKDVLGTSLTILFAAMLVVVAGIIIIFNLIQYNFELNRERNYYRNISIVDGLTGIYNRRFLEESMDRIIKSLGRTGGELSVLMMDVDYFKKYNDTYGHNMGDICLKTMANTFAQSIVRADDFVARYGGEEFIIVLPNTSEHGAETVAERVLVNIRERNIPHQNSEAAACVTVSIGCMTSAVLHSHSAADFIKKADEALYRSKQDGRNRFTAAR